jgi:hypothetical protein
MSNRLAPLAFLLLLAVVPGCTPLPAPSPTNAVPAQTPLTSTSIPRRPSSVTAEPAVAGLEFSATGYTEYGEWSCNVSATPSAWKPGDSVKVTARLRVTMDHMGGLSALGLLPEGLCALMTAERTFDADGILRLPSDERMSTILTPSGLAIEGGVQGAVTDRFGAYSFRTPVDEFQTVRFSQMAKTEGYREATFSLAARLPNDLPPGIYRLRIDFGVLSAKRYYSLNGETFAYRPFFKGRPTESHIYSPPIRASGRHVSGRDVDAASIRPRLPWSSWPTTTPTAPGGRLPMKTRTALPSQTATLSRTKLCFL